jgi:hypothetical protein
MIFPHLFASGGNLPGSGGTLEIRAFRPLHPDASRLVEIAVKRWVVPLGRICWVILNQKNWIFMDIHENYREINGIYIYIIN